VTCVQVARARPDVAWVSQFEYVEITAALTTKGRAPPRKISPKTARKAGAQQTKKRAKRAKRSARSKS